MAKVLSGSFDTNTIRSRYLTFSWSATQDYEKNETTISWELKCNGTATTYNKSAPFSVVIDGEQVYYSTDRIQLYVGTVVKTGTKTLSHNSDGSRSFSASVKAAIYDASYNATGSGSWDLADIPRGAVMTKVPTTFTDEDSPTIEFTNYLGNSVDSVSVCLSLDNYYSTIPYRAVGKTDKSYQFVFTDEEKAKIYEYTKETNSLKVSFYILTIINGEEYRSKLFSTLKVVNANPVIDSFTVEETSRTDLTGSASKMIVEHNYITAAAAYTLQKGAELDYIEIMNHKGELFADSSAEFVDAISPIFEVYVRDSRGNEAYETVELEAINYIPLTCNIEAEIKLSETNTENAEIESRIYGNYFNNSFGAENNILSIKLEYNGSDGGYYEDIITLTKEDFDGNTYDKTIEKDSLSYKQTWVVKAIAMDYLTTASKESKQLTALPVFDWSKEDFNFNVPIHYENKPIDFVVEQDTKDGWFFRKWYSGFCECWKTYTYNTAINTKWGNTGMYVASPYMPRQTYPFEFAEKPVEQATLQSATSAAWLVAESAGNGENTKTQSAVYNVCRAAAITSTSNYYISLYVYGKI
jgi:hypothetical protein